MHRIIEPSLKGLEFEDDFAARWWPLGRARGVVIDPKRQFGATWLIMLLACQRSFLRALVEAEGSIVKAARAFMVPPASVRRAVAFEERRAA